MPVVGEHTARITNPDKYVRIRRQNNRFAPGIHVNFGVLKDGKTEVQSIHFDAAKFTISQAKSWLKGHNFKPIEFEPAVQKNSALDNSEDDIAWEDEDLKHMEDVLFEDDNQSIDNLLEAEYPELIDQKMDNLDDLLDEKENFSDYEVLNFTCKLELAEETNEYGIIKGWAATYGKINDEVFVEPGAFTKSIQYHQQKGKMIKMTRQHNREAIIGGFSPEKMKDFKKGLFVEGEINKKTTVGMDSYELAKQGVLSDFSIAALIKKSTIDEDTGLRHMNELFLYAIGLVDLPADSEANVTTVQAANLEQTATTFKNLPLADDKMQWDSVAAAARVRKFTNSTDKASATYRNAFFWFDESKPDLFGSYKLPFADVVGNKLVAVPRGIQAAAGAMRGARQPVNIPQADRARVITHINKYYKKMGDDSPLKNFIENKNNQNELKFDISDVENIETRKEFNKFLGKSGVFSRAACEFLASCFSPKQSKSAEDKISDEHIASFNQKLDMLIKLTKSI